MSPVTFTEKELKLVIKNEINSFTKEELIKLDERGPRIYLFIE